MTLLDVSQKLFGSKGNSYDSQSLGGSDNADASVVYGEAVVDAASGEVSVLIDGTAIDNDPDSPDYQMGDYITCDTDELIQAGDRVTVIRNGQNLKAMAISPDTLGVTAAITAANQAQAVANAVNQHFWHRSTDPDGDGAGTGAFVTDEEQDDFLTAAAAGFADYDPSTKPYRNVLMNSLGFLIREALHNLASFTQSAVSFFDGSGNTTATFGTSGAVIGLVEDGFSRTEISNSGMNIFQRSSGSDIPIASLAYGYSYDSQGTLIPNPYFTFGERNPYNSIGCYSVAEGFSCTASADCSHAEGGASQAKGICSHAEGHFTLASGYASHAQNDYTLAYSDYQTAMGRYNVSDSADTYALIIGNGTSDNARSNALTVKWDGTVQDGAGNVIAPYKVTRFVPSSTTAQTLSTSAALLTSMGTKELDTAGVTVDSNVFTVPEAGLWRITAQVGEYPASTAKTRLCVGIYDTSVSGTRWALGVQAVYNLTANTASQVVTIECSTVRQLAASAKVAIGVFADVANAKVLKSDAGITNITFEKVG